MKLMTLAKIALLVVLAFWLAGPALRLAGRVRRQVVRGKAAVERLVGLAEPARRVFRTERGRRS